MLYRWCWVSLEWEGSELWECFLWRFHSCRYAFEVVVHRVVQFGFVHTIFFSLPESATLQKRVTVSDCQWTQHANKSDIKECKVLMISRQTHAIAWNTPNHSPTRFVQRRNVHKKIWLDFQTMPANSCVAWHAIMWERRKFAKRW